MINNNLDRYNPKFRILKSFPNPTSAKFEIDSEKHPDLVQMIEIFNCLDHKDMVSKLTSMRRSLKKEIESSPLKGFDLKKILKNSEEYLPPTLRENSATLLYEGPKLLRFKKLLMLVYSMLGILYANGEHVPFNLNKANNKFRRSFVFGSEGYRYYLRNNYREESDLILPLALEALNARSSKCCFDMHILEQFKDRSIEYLSPQILLQELKFKFYKYLAKKGALFAIKEYTKFLEEGVLFAPAKLHAHLWYQKAMLLVSPKEYEFYFEKLNKLSQEITLTDYRNEENKFYRFESTDKNKTAIQAWKNLVKKKRVDRMC